MTKRAYARVYKDELPVLADMTQGEILVFFALRLFARNNGEAWPSLLAIQAAVGVPMRNVCRCLKRLIERGFVQRESGGGRKTTKYKLATMSSAPQDSAPQDSAPQDSAPQDRAAVLPRTEQQCSPGHCHQSNSPINSPINSSPYPLTESGGASTSKNVASDHDEKGGQDQSRIGQNQSKGEQGGRAFSSANGAEAQSHSPRAMGTNPRAMGANPRAVSSNPRAIGTNPRAEHHADDFEEAKALIAQIGVKSGELRSRLLKETVGQLNRLVQQHELGYAKPGLLLYRARRDEPLFTNQFLDWEEERRQELVAQHRPDLVPPPKETRAAPPEREPVVHQPTLEELRERREILSAQPMFRNALKAIEAQIAAQEKTT